MRPGDLGLVLSPFQDTLKSGLLDRMVGEARTLWPENATLRF